MLFGFSTLALGALYGLSQASLIKAAPASIQPLVYSPACANANSNNGAINGDTYYNCYYPETFNDNCGTLRDRLSRGECNLSGYVSGNGRCLEVGDGSDRCTVCSDIQDDGAACGAMYTVMATVQDQCQNHLGSICNGAGYDSLTWVTNGQPHQAMPQKRELLEKRDDTFIIDQQIVYYLDDSNQQALGNPSRSGSYAVSGGVTVSRTEEVGSTVGASGIITATVSYSVSTTMSYSKTVTQTVDFDICNGSLGQAYFNPYFVRIVGHFENSGETASRNEPMVHDDGAAWGVVDVNCGV